MALVKQQDGEELIIKPEAVTPSVDTSGWPLLLKNWDQRMSIIILVLCYMCSRQRLTKGFQSSSEPATSHPSPPAARHCVATSNPTFRPA